MNTAASPTLHVIFGPSGAGKSTYGADLARRERAVAFSIDDWMARLFAQDMPQQPDFNWLMERVERCEAQIWSTAAAVMAAVRTNSRRGSPCGVWLLLVSLMSVPSVTSSASCPASST